jgi:hypothetical protein
LYISYIISYVTYASPGGKQGVVGCSHNFFKTIIRRREGFVRVLCIVPMLIIHPHRWKHDVGGGNQGCVRWNVRLVQRFLRGKKIIFIHPTTNIYAMLAPKTFLHILTIDSMHPIGHHVP